MAPTPRDPWLDNAKMGLVTLVVVGHLLALLPADGVGGHLYDFVYLWHMPAFVFLSGYLSRGFRYTPARLWQLVTTLLVPYVLFEGALGWFRINVGGEQLADLWADPHFPLWYLLAMVAWRLVTPLMRPLRGGVAVAVGICIAGGFLAGDWTRWLDAPRILGFLPFFVLGLKATPEALEWLRGRFPAAIGVATFAALWVVSGSLDQWAGRDYLYARPFALLDDPTSTAVLTRLLVLLAGVVGACAWLSVVPRVGGWFTRMGSATLVVYLFHGFVVKELEYLGFVAWAHDRPGPGLLAAVGIGVAVAMGLAAPPVRRVLERVVDPFDTAHRRLREAVQLTEVVQEQHQVSADAGLATSGR
ncbi:acyltransferase family protein [Nocardioides daeguensis]|uniref:Acyltransferase family protein n=1 Tax=Nocardioides daeguensis TaxID=908359 RepID=A0ABP6WM79_9ACTN|nr:acyltransferase family protein [Nocardioides daeguensis]MBV6729032.1 acyltransferase family protein [Nocardioides daeguensis]MCR1774964.1 acyltransferase family protein [Nocardioides daeguensis]